MIKCFRSWMVYSYLLAFLLGCVFLDFPLAFGAVPVRGDSTDPLDRVLTLGEVRKLGSGPFSGEGTYVDTSTTFTLEVALITMLL